MKHIKKFESFGLINESTRIQRKAKGKPEGIYPEDLLAFLKDKKGDKKDFENGTLYLSDLTGKEMANWTSLGGFYSEKVLGAIRDLKIKLDPFGFTISHPQTLCDIIKNLVVSKPPVINWEEFKKEPGLVPPGLKKSPEWSKESIDKISQREKFDISTWATSLLELSK